MATLKVFDGTSWNVVAGQGPPGMGVPAGGAAGALLAKNTAADADTTWTTSTLVEAGGTRVAINGPPVSSGPALRMSPPTPSSAAADIWQAPAQNHQILRIINAGGSAVPWFIDRYGYPKQFVQAGSAVVNTDVFGTGGPIYYPEPFLTQPIVVATESSGVYAQCSLNISNVYPAYFYVHIATPAGANWQGGFRVNWIAYETRT